MSAWTRVTFEPGRRDPEAVAAELLAADGQRDVDVVDGDVVMYESTPLFGLEDVDPPCERALSFWQDDTSMAGGGWLYERVDGRFVRTDEYGDEDFGDETANYFAVEHGIVAHQR